MACCLAPARLTQDAWCHQTGRRVQARRQLVGRQLLRPTAFQIDRRHHMELQWQRHQEEEALLAAVPSALAQGGVIEVAGQRHLDALLEASAGQLVVLTIYSRSCGICKEVLRELEAACRECRQQRARVVFLRHDMLDAWDWPSDVARWYRLKTAPRFLFFVDGALLCSSSLADSRTLAGSRGQVQSWLRAEHRKFRHTLWRLLAQHAPSARR